MEKKEHAMIEWIKKIVEKAYDKSISTLEYKIKELQGGTLGEVRLVSGTARSVQGEDFSYRIVWKTQKKWNRIGDANSWRREYDVAASSFFDFIPQVFCLPRFYYHQIEETQNQLWMEYLQGVSGVQLRLPMLCEAAKKLGEMQGILLEEGNLWKQFSFLSKENTMKETFYSWTENTREHQFLHSKECDLPIHLKEMFLNMQQQADSLFESFAQLPTVLCHKDFWIENLFYQEGNIGLIDWDCVGEGYLGEDIACLIVDDTETEDLPKYYEEITASYQEGLKGYLPKEQIEILPIWEMILIQFGYRILRRYLFSEVEEEKSKVVKRLQTIYDLKYGQNREK